MFKKLIILALTVGAVGCAGVQNAPLSQDSLPMIEGRQVSGVNWEKPDFIATTPGKAAFGALGLPAMISAGNKLVEENNIPVPADKIYDELVAAMAKNYRVVPLDDNTISAQDDDVESLTKQVDDSRLLLDVRSTYWTYVNYAFSPTKYKVSIAAKMRLIDSATDEVLAASQCISPFPEDADAAPTHDELVANGAERLKLELDKATDYCIAEFKSKTLML